MPYAIADVDGHREAQHAHTVAALRSARARLREDVRPAVADVFAALSSAPLLVLLRRSITNQSLQAQANLAGIEDLADKVLSVATLPPTLWRVAQGWVDVRAELSRIAGDLGVTNREIHIFWQGVAADTYHRVLPAHVDAATRLAGAADAVQFCADWTGSAGATLYVSVLATLVEGMATILASAATALMAPALLPGVAVFLLMTSADLFDRMAELVHGAIDTMGRAVLWGTELRSELRDRSAFPLGNWPEARTEWLADATVTDGDAEWSVMP